MKKINVSYKILFLLVILFILSTITGCIPKDDRENPSALTVDIIATEISEDDDSNSFNYYVEWETQENATSTVYYGEDSANLTLFIETKSGEKLRDVTIPGLLPDTTYYYIIISTIGPVTGGMENPDDFTTPDSYTLKNKIIGHLHYTEVFQLGGDFVVDLWDANDPNIFDYSLSSPVRTVEINPADVTQVGDDYDADFEILAGVGQWKLRIYRDWVPDLEHNTVTEAYNPSAALIQISTVDVNIGNITVSEPTQEVTTIYVDPISNVKSEQSTTVTFRLKNQWGSTHTLDTTVTLTALNTNVDVTTPQPVNYIGASGQFSELIFFEKTPPGVQSTFLEAAVGTTTGVTASTFDVTAYLIDLTINYTTNDRYNGDLIIQVDDGSLTWTIYNDSIANASLPVGVNASDTFTSDEDIPFVGVENGDYKIRVFRDENGNGNYDALTEAYDVIPNVNIDGADGVATLNVTEPAISKENITVVLTSAASINSGGTIDVDITLTDQWGQLYAADAHYPIPLQLVDFAALTPANVIVNDIMNVVGADTRLDSDTVEDTNKNGTISATLQLYKVSNSTLLADKRSDIQGTWSGTALTDTTGTITVNNRIISGTFTYNDNGDQPNGTLTVELWDKSTTNNNFTAGARIDVDIDGNNSINFEAPNSNGGQYYLRVYRDFSGSPALYDETDSDDVLMDAYLVYGGVGSPTTVTVTHADENEGLIGTFGNKTRQIYNVSAVVNPPTSIPSGANVTVDVTSTDQWSVAYSGGGTVNFSWLGAGVTLGTTTAASAGGSATLNTTLTNDVAQQENTNQIRANLDTITDDTANITVDGKSPSFVSAQVPGAGTTLVITFDEPLLVNVPSTSSFSVSAASSVSVTGTSVSGTDLTLTLDRTIEAGETVTVTYDGTGATKVQDLVSNNANTFTNNAVTNSSGQSIAPTFVSAQVPSAGTTLVITFDEPLLVNVPSTSSFSVSAISSVSVTGTSVSGTDVTLTLNRTIETGETVTVTYDGTGATKVQDLVNNNANTFTNNAVTNNSTQSIAPSFVSAQVPAAGTTLVITFDEPLLVNVPSTSSFSVSAISSVSVTGTSVSGTDVTLTLNRTIETGENVTVTYDGTGAIKIKDLVNNNANTFTNNAVTNSSTQVIPPGFVSAGIPAAGTTLIITFDEPLLVNVPTAAQFTVNAAVAATVTGTSVTGNTVILTLSRTIETPETVTVSYDGTGPTTIQDLLTNDANTFTNNAVTNSSTVATPPNFSSAQVPVAGTTLVITFDENLTVNNPDASQFTLNGTGATVASASATGTTVTLTLNNVIQSSDTVTVSYDGTGAIKIKDLVGNNANTFANQAVTNLSTQDTVPVILSATIPSAGTTIIMEYDQMLTTNSPDNTRFTLGGTAVTVTGASANGTTVTLSLSGTIFAIDTITLNYNNTVPPTIIRDVPGNAAAALAGYSVTNDSTQ